MVGSGPGRSVTADRTPVHDSCPRLESLVQGDVRGWKVFRDNWRSPAFWRWWWRNSVPAEVQLPLAFAFIALLLVGGYFAAGQLSGASAADSSGSYGVATIRKIVTVRQDGKLVVKHVPVVVRRNVVHSQTSYQTVVDKQVVTTPGGVRRVVTTVSRLLPVERVVNVTSQSTVVVDHTDTVVQPVTSFETTTVTLPPVTVTATVTVPVVSTVTVTVTASATP
jgi:hypothetical protein